MQSISTIEHFIHRNFNNNFQLSDMGKIIYHLLIFTSLFFLLSTICRDRKKTSALFRFLTYLYISIFSISYLKNESWLFSFPGITLESTLDGNIQYHYIYEISLYIFLTIIIDSTVKDYPVMLLHHFITLTLIILSYSKNMLRYGIFIMAIHDCADPFLEIAKLFNYINFQIISKIFFSAFLLIFIINRLVIFPYFCIYPAIYYLYEYGHMITFVFFNIILLIVIFVCNVIWTYFILKVALKIIFNREINDIREKKN